MKYTPQNRKECRLLFDHSCGNMSSHAYDNNREKLTVSGPISNLLAN